MACKEKAEGKALKVNDSLVQACTFHAGQSETRQIAELFTSSIARAGTNMGEEQKAAVAQGAVVLDDCDHEITMAELRDR